MRLTTRARYAVTAMLDIALYQGDGFVTMTSIVSRQDLPQEYLAQIFQQLRQAGILKSVRGVRGGYILGRPARDISVKDIMEAVEDKVSVIRCGGAENCKRGAPCLTHGLWEKLESVIGDFLSNISLESLVLSHTKQCVGGSRE